MTRGAGTTKTSQRSRAARVAVSEKARGLVATFGDAQFDCGEWTDDETVNYEAVCDMAETAEASLLEYIADLERRAE